MTRQSGEDLPSMQEVSTSRSTLRERRGLSVIFMTSAGVCTSPFLWVYLYFPALYFLPPRWMPEATFTTFLDLRTAFFTMLGGPSAAIIAVTSWRLLLKSSRTSSHRTVWLQLGAAAGGAILLYVIPARWQGNGTLTLPVHIFWPCLTILLYGALRPADRVRRTKYDIFVTLALILSLAVYIFPLPSPYLPRLSKMPPFLLMVLFTYTLTCVLLLFCVVHLFAKQRRQESIRYLMCLGIAFVVGIGLGAMIYSANLAAINFRWPG